MSTTFKLLMMSLLITVSTTSSPANPPSGGVLDILQIGRSAIVVNIDRSQLPQELCNETLTVSLSHLTGKIIRTQDTDTNTLNLSLIGLPNGTYILRLKVGNNLLDEQEFTL